MLPLARLPHLRRVPAVVLAALLGTGLVVGAARVLAGLPLATTGQDYHEPGTQPGSLMHSIVDSTGCTGCHSGYDEAQEPYRRWAASMMGQAGRDPIFHAALAIANQDAAESGQLCLRCHAPGAWLDGRGVPGDGSALDPQLGDLDGVTCNFCHRMVDPVYRPGWSPPVDAAILAALPEPPVASPHTGQFVIDPQDRRRGPFDLGVFFYHSWEKSHYHVDSRLCGTCHDVSNPALSRQLDGSYQLNTANQAHPTQEAADEFPVERTFSEWSLSDYAQREIDTGGRFGGTAPTVSSCQDCHMPRITGTACVPALGGAVRPDLPQHDFNGANSWVLSAIRNLYPDSETGLSAASVAASQTRNQQMLAAGSELRLARDAAGLRVRILNHGGHKLPTGYGEGRRMWINVRFLNASAQLVAERGAYDSGTAVLTGGDTKVFELVQGLDATMAGVTGLPQGESFHFVLNNTVLKDNRIPPRGFTNAGFEAIQAAPVGASFAEQQYWDDTLFAIPPGAVTAEVRLYHQTSSKEYIEFLQSENTTNSAGTTAYNQWVATGKSAPVLMQFGSIALGANSYFAPVPYGLGKRSSNGSVPVLGFTGSPSLSTGGMTLTISNGMPNKLAVALCSRSMASTPFAGATRLIGDPSWNAGATMLGPTGSGTIPVPPATSIGSSLRNYQIVMRDPAGSFGIGLSNALHVQFAP